MHQSIPDNIKHLADSAELFDTCESIGKKFGLHIDQIGELDAQVRAVLRGNADSKTFSSDIKKYLEIEYGTADEITKEVNEQIFKSLRQSILSESQPSIVKDNSSLEQAGGFQIENDLPTNGEESFGNMRGYSAFSSGDKINMMDNLENPTPTESRTEPKDPEQGKNPHIEPLADQLLGIPASKPEEKVEVSVETEEPREIPKDPTPQPPSNLPTNDPYREPMK